MEIEIDVLDLATKKSLAVLNNLTANSSIADLKRSFYNIKPKYYPERQSFRTEQKGKSLKDSETLKGVGLSDGGRIFFKDLGIQIGWSTVFVVEYAGPLFLYLMFYARPSFIYPSIPAAGTALASHIACLCWCGHYLKRILETLFVHRFSHSTMPLFNLFKNCSYYWGFTVFVAYSLNHPLYTPPFFGAPQLIIGLAAFLLSEVGNLSIHLSLKNLRPAGSNARKIPFPDSNPFTKLFNLVSCPNYTYEAAAWFSFAILSQSFPALMFGVVGLCQMSLWALGKHRNYKKEFSEYPRDRKAILPFIL